MFTGVPLEPKIALKLEALLLNMLPTWHGELSPILSRATTSSRFCVDFERNGSSLCVTFKQWFTKSRLTFNIVVSRGSSGGAIQNWKETLKNSMTVHRFSTTSSPGCANFALKTTADQYEETWGSEAADFEQIYSPYKLKSLWQPRQFTLCDILAVQALLSHSKFVLRSHANNIWFHTRPITCELSHKQVVTVIFSSSSLPCA